MINQNSIYTKNQPRKYHKYLCTSKITKKKQNKQTIKRLLIDFFLRRLSVYDP